MSTRILHWWAFKTKKALKQAILDELRSIIVFSFYKSCPKIDPGEMAEHDFLGVVYECVLMVKHLTQSATSEEYLKGFDESIRFRRAENNESA